jgi:hypothetical protein
MFLTITLRFLIRKLIGDLVWLLVLLLPLLMFSVPTMLFSLMNFGSPQVLQNFILFSIFLNSLESGSLFFYLRLSNTYWPFSEFLIWMQLLWCNLSTGCCFQLNITNRLWTSILVHGGNFGVCENWVAILAMFCCKLRCDKTSIGGWKQ